jgi:hypothetical protein
MEIVTRTIFLKGDPDPVAIAIRVFRPEQLGKSWGCAYEINWPEGSKRMTAHGVDALQSLIIALQMIGSELYASEYHRLGQLFVEGQEGYGFPVAQNMRHLLVGLDAEMF